MNEKMVVTVRFNPEGVEAELHQKIQQEKKAAGLSTPEFVKYALTEYFKLEEKQKTENHLLKEILLENQKLAEEIKDFLSRCIENGQTVSGGLAVKEDNRENIVLPAMGMEIPEGAFDFLGCV